MLDYWEKLCYTRVDEFLIVFNRVVYVNLCIMIICFNPFVIIIIEV